MWQRFRLIALTYFTRTFLLLMFAVYALLPLPFLLAAYGLIPRPLSPAIRFLVYQETDQFAERFGMLFSTVSWLGFVAFFVGAHLKQQFANPRARLLPGFAGSHLSVVMVLFATLLAWVVLLAWGALGMSLLGCAAIAIHVGALGLWMGCRPSLLVFGLLNVTVLGSVISAVGRGLLMEIATGAEPILAMLLISAHVVSLVVLMNHLTWLSEDDPDYANVLPLNAWDLRATSQRAFQRTMLANDNRSMAVLNAMELSAGAVLDRATAVPATTPRQRIALFALGEIYLPAPFSLNQYVIGPATSVLILMGGLYLFPTSMVMDFPSSFVIGFAVFFAWIRWMIWLLRWPRLGYESLRPVSRHEWVWENGVTIAKSVALNHVATALIPLPIVAVLLPDALSAPTLWRLLIWSTACQVLVFGAFAWLTSYGSTWLLMICACIAGVTLLILTLTFMSAKLELNLPTIIGLSVGTAVLGVIVTRQAMKRWCRMDLP